jgi:L-fuconolactonase
MSTNSLTALGVTDAIDAHIHPWLLTNLPPVIEGARNVRPDLAQDYSPATIITTAQASGCSKVILVQARDPHEDSRGEAEFFIAAAKEHPEVVGCVIGIDLLDTAGTERVLLDLASDRAVRSCRMIAPENKGVGILSDGRAQSTAKLLGEFGLRLDLLVRSSNSGQLGEAVAFVRWLATNSATVVIGDHLLKPTGVAEGTPSKEWLDSLGELAMCPNFYMKLSGLPGEVPPGTSSESFWPFYDAAFEAFGASRLLFGSDHPVSYGHATSVSAVARWLSSRGLAHSTAAQQIFAASAREAYALHEND